jgi:formyl-CoA transferase
MRRDVRNVDAMLKLSQTPGALGARPPRLGEHTREILMRHGFSDREISRMADQEIVQVDD